MSYNRFPLFPAGFIPSHADYTELIMTNRHRPPVPCDSVGR